MVKRRMAMRGWVDTPLRPCPPSTMTTREPSGACSVTIGDCSSSRASDTPIDSVSRFWNAASSSAESHSWPTSTLRPSSYDTHVVRCELTSISSTVSSLMYCSSGPVPTVSA